MAGLFIDDGWTLTYTVPARGPIPALTVHYRPALPARVRRWLRERENARGKEKAAESATAEIEADVSILADQLVNWNVDAELNAAHLRRLWPTVLGALLDVVSGHTVPDLEGAEKNSGTG